MGCGLIKPSAPRHNLATNSVPLSITHTRSNNDLIDKRRQTENRRLSSHIATETDFWGTIPFYVLSNRIRLLSFEVNNKQTQETINSSILEILQTLIESPCENLAEHKIDGKRYNWIFRYKNGYKVIRSLGLNIDKKKSVRVMEGLTKKNVEKKLKEVKYALSILDDNLVTEVKFNRAFTIN